MQKVATKSYCKKAVKNLLLKSSYKKLLKTAPKKQLKTIIKPAIKQTGTSNIAFDKGIKHYQLEKEHQHLEMFTMNIGQTERIEENF